MAHKECTKTLSAAHLWVLLPMLIKPEHYVSDRGMAVAVGCCAEEVVNAWVCGGVVATVLWQWRAEQNGDVLVEHNVLPVRHHPPAKQHRTVIFKEQALHLDCFAIT
jgi:hypothetical protein